MPDGSAAGGQCIAWECKAKDHLRQGGAGGRARTLEGGLPKGWRGLRKGVQKDSSRVGGQRRDRHIVWPILCCPLLVTRHGSAGQIGPDSGSKAPGLRCRDNQ